MGHGVLDAASPLQFHGPSTAPGSVFPEATNALCRHFWNASSAMVVPCITHACYFASWFECLFDNVAHEYMP